jgi:hypothetical protein
MGEIIRGSSKCCECGELIDWKVERYTPRDPSEEVGMVTYSIVKPCPSCRIKHYIDIDIDNSVKIKSTGEKVSKREKKSYVFANVYKSKTKEELMDRVKDIFIKWINQ